MSVSERPDGRSRAGTQREIRGDETLCTMQTHPSRKEPINAPLPLILEWRPGGGSCTAETEAPRTSFDHAKDIPITSYILIIVENSTTISSPQPVIASQRVLPRRIASCS